MTTTKRIFNPFILPLFLSTPKTDSDTLVVKSKETLIIDYEINHKVVKIFAPIIIIKSKISTTHLLIKSKTCHVIGSIQTTDFENDSVLINDGIILAKSKFSSNGSIYNYGKIKFLTGQMIVNDLHNFNFIEGTSNLHINGKYVVNKGKIMCFGSTINIRGETFKTFGDIIGFVTTINSEKVYIDKNSTLKISDLYLNNETTICSKNLNIRNLNINSKNISLCSIVSEIKIGIYQDSKSFINITHPMLCKNNEMISGLVLNHSKIKAMDSCKIYAYNLKDTTGFTIYNCGIFHVGFFDINGNGYQQLKSNASVIADKINLGALKYKIKSKLYSETDINIQCGIQYGSFSDCNSDVFLAKGTLNFIYNILQNVEFVKTFKLIGSIRYTIFDQFKLDAKYERRTFSLKCDQTCPNYITFDMDKIEILLSHKLIAKDTLTINSHDAFILAGAKIFTNNLTVNGRSIQFGNMKDENNCAIMVKNNCILTATPSVTNPCEANGTIALAHVELNVGNLISTGKKFSNLSSEINVDKDATFNGETIFFMLTERKENGHIVGGPSSPIDGFHFHKSYKTILSSEQMVTKPAYMSVNGKLTINAPMEIFGSMVHCITFVNNGIVPKVTTFVPYTSYQDNFLCGNKHYHKAHWEPHPVAKNVGTPFHGKLSIAGTIETKSKLIEISGIVTADMIKFSGIEKGKIGHFNLELKLPEIKPFKQRISLIDYFTKTNLYQITKPDSGSECVFQEIN
jgi:hypothetical protein